MRTLEVAFLLLLAGSTAPGQEFTRFVGDLDHLPGSKRQKSVDRYLKEVKAFPITEDSLAHFVYTGGDSAVAVAGDFTGWNVGNGVMTHVEGTALWYRTERLDPAARLDYKIVASGNWILDPRNPLRVPSGFGENSELRMPKYRPSRELEIRPRVPKGSVRDMLFTSRTLGNTRKIAIYTPPGYDKGDGLHPLVIVHDGLEYISMAKMNVVLDNLIAEKKIRPLIAVFIPPVERGAEYIDTRQELFTELLAGELLPWIDSSYRTERVARSRGMIGSSAGATIALHAGVRYPQLFGNLGLFSPNLLQADLDVLDSLPPHSLRILVLHGRYDHLGVIRSSVEKTLPILRGREYEHRFILAPEGHSYGLWRGYLAETLRFFFPPARRR